jgi:hypothetical protein
MLEGGDFSVKVKSLTTDSAEKTHELQFSRAESRLRTVP